MAFKLANRTRQFVTSTGAIGVGVVVNLGAVTNIDINTFAASVGDTNQTVVCFVSGNGIDWQECKVTVTDAATDTLTINEIIASSIAGVIGTSAITLVGTSRVFGIIPTDFDYLFNSLYGNAVGSLFYVDVTGKWRALARGGSGSVLRASGTNIEWDQQTLKEAASVASTSPLPNAPTYSNGTGGDGATLTASSNGIPTIDGVNAFSVGYRVLVAGEANATHNGLFEFTQIGAGVPYILTRTSDWNGTAVAAGGVQLGDTVSIYGGTANKGLWAFTAFTPAGTVTFGTSQLTFEKIASNVAAITTFISSGAWSATAAYSAYTFVKRNGVWYINNGAISAPSATFGFEGLATLSSTAVAPTINITTANNSDEILVIAALPHDANSVVSITSTSGLIFTRRARITRNLISGFRVALELWNAPAGKALSAETLTITTDVVGAFATSARYVAVGVTGARIITGPFDSNGAMPATASGDATPASVSYTTSTATDRLLFISANTNDGSHTPNSTAPTGFTQLSFLGITGTGVNSTQLNICYEDVSATQSAAAVSSTESPSCWVAIGSALVRGSAENAEPSIDPRWIKAGEQVDSATLDEMFGTAVGTLIQRGTNGWQALVPGAAGTVLTANGAGSINSFQSPGSGSSGLWGSKITAPPTSVITGLTTWLNQGTATITDDTFGVTIFAPSTGGDSVRARIKAAPGTTPYSFTGLIDVDTTAVGNFISVMLGWYDGTNKIHAIELLFATNWSFRVGKYTNPTTFSAADTTSTNIIRVGLNWFRIRDDGTNAVFLYSHSGNESTFKTLFTVAKSAGHLGATGYSNILFGVSAIGRDVKGTLEYLAQGS